MRSLTKKTFIGLALAALTLPSAYAYKLNFSYSDESDQQYVFGTKKVDSYDAAILINEPGLAGKSITAVKLPFYVDEELADIKVWASSDLALDENKEAVTDLLCVEVPEFSLEEKTFTLPEPFVIPEEGCYFGISFSVSQLLSERSGMPLIVTAKYIPGSFYLHTAKTYKKWTDYSASNGAVLDIYVEVDGKFTNNACGIVEAPDTYSSIGQESPSKIYVTNHGINTINSIEYLAEIGDQSLTGEYTFATAIPAVYGARRQVEFSLPAAKEGGVQDYKFTVVKVNGKDNTETANSATGSVNVLSIVPVFRPVLEEWTGTQCPYCTRGLAGLEACAQDDPENFIGISYHGFNTNDPMYMKNGATGTYSRAESGLTPIIEGFPSAYINRSTPCDAYTGTSGKNLGIVEDLRKARTQVVNADVQLEAVWTEPGVIDATSTVTWVQQPADGKTYRLEFVLIAHDLHTDDLTDSDWWQYNNYSGDKGKDMPGMEYFSESGFYVKGYHFNDVAVLKSTVYGNGLEGSVAEPLLNTPDAYTHRFLTSEAVNLQGKPIIQDGNNLEVVVMLLEDDKNYGTVVNANKCRISGDSSVRDLTASEAAPASVTYYNLSGSAVANPEKGIFVKVTTLADGSLKAEKIIKK